MSINWESTDYIPVFVILTAALGYTGYYFLSTLPPLGRWIHRRFKEDRAEVATILSQKLTGFVFLGLLPGMMIVAATPLKITRLGINLSFPLTGLYWLLVLVPVVILINLINARKPNNLVMYPQIRIRNWSYSILLLSSLGWAFYLLAYEFLFRGILLSGSMHFIGVWPAIALNVAFYVLAHLPKGAKESLSSIPMGIVLCLATIQTGSIWVAFIIHLALALSNEYLSIYYHPEMKVVRHNKEEIR